MLKNFDVWNHKKKAVDILGSSPFYHKRELWWCTLGVNVGSEQDGSGIDFRRPVIVLKGLGRDTCIVIPLTTSTRDHSLRPSIGMIANKPARALLSQLRVIDTKRLTQRIGYLNKEIFENVRKAVKELL